MTSPSGAAPTDEPTADQGDRSPIGPGDPTPGDPTPDDPIGPGDPTPGDPTPGDPTQGDPTPGDPIGLGDPIGPGDPTPGDRSPHGRPTAARVASDGRDAAVDPPGPAMRAVAFGLVAAVLTGLLLWVFAAILALSAGLLVVAFFLGRIIGLSVRSGAGDGLPSAARTSISVLWSIGAITVAMVATWLFAGLSGGVLGLGAYLVETLGPIVPLQYMIATVAAWWTSR